MINNNNIINIYNQNINKNNINGSFYIGDYPFFYKINSYYDYKKELNGYRKIKKYYNVPRLIYKKANDNNGILIYEYNKSIYDNHGLLVDYFAKNNTITNDFIIILNQYKNVFEKTLKFKYTKNVDIFFKDRVNSRLEKYYNEDFCNSLDSLKPIKFKNKTINLQKVQNIIEDVKKFYSLRRQTYTVISQCDPNDLNICEDGMILDYLCGGDTPLMAEFATFIWYYIAQGEYLSIKYNKKAFNSHDEIYKIKNDVSLSDNCLRFNIRPIRKDAINMYIDLIIEPIIKKTNFENWYEEFKNYLSMKILAVFNLNNMEQKDKILSLVYLILFYEKDNIKNTDDLKKFLNSIY